MLDDCPPVMYGICQVCRQRLEAYQVRVLVDVAEPVHAFKMTEHECLGAHQQPAKLIPPNTRR